MPYNVFYIVITASENTNNAFVPPKTNNVRNLQDQLKTKLDALEQFNYQNKINELKTAGVAKEQKIIVDITPDSTIEHEERG